MAAERLGQGNKKGGGGGGGGGGGRFDPPMSAHLMDKVWLFVLPRQHLCRYAGA